MDNLNDSPTKNVNDETLLAPVARKIGRILGAAERTTDLVLGTVELTAINGLIAVAGVWDRLTRTRAAH